MENIFEYKTLEAKVGTMSLIGTGHSRPVSWGNYFWLSKGPRIVNFWAENLESAVSLFLSDGMVRVRVYTDGDKDFGLIDDDRIPEDWYYKKLCFTGGYLPSEAILKDMYEYSGTIEEMEQHTDPVSYYAKKGIEAKVSKIKGDDNSEGMTILSLNIEAKSRPLSTEWILEEQQELNYKGKELEPEYYIYAPYIPNVDVVDGNKAVESLQKLKDNINYESK
jgi:hypothetical protein